MVKGPCQNCDMRYVTETEDGKILTCHSECPQYRVFRQEKEKETQMRKAYFAPLTEQYVEHQYQVFKAIHKKHRNYWR